MKDIRGIQKGCQVTVRNTAKCRPFEDIYRDEKNNPCSLRITGIETILPGQAVILTTGAKGDFVEFSLDNNTYQPENIFVSLQEGKYIIFVRDGVGCITYGTFIVTQSGTFYGLSDYGFGICGL
jgi:hypothetical protein